MPKLSPFIYPGPVPATRFVGRREAVHTILSRIVTGQNTAVVGEPNIGKSSLLRYLAESKECIEQFGPQVLVVSQDCHFLPGDCTPDDFWKNVLGHVWAKWHEEKEVYQVLVRIGDKKVHNRDLERLFRIITRNGWRLALLIDEFDSLLGHPGLNHAAFFGALRSLSTRFSGLALVTAGRLSVSRMNEISQELNPHGSPFFNAFIEVNLRPFGVEDAEMLLDTASAGTGIAFGSQERAFIRELGGGHPFLLQAAAGALYDATVNNYQRRYRAATDTFYRQTEAHFSDLWRHLDSRSRTAVTILCLGEVAGRVANEDFNTGDIAILNEFSNELRRLADQGLVELRSKGGWQADSKNWVIWHGQRWRVTSRRLTWWVIDQVVSRNEVDWETWLDAKRFHGLLTQEMIDTLRSWQEGIPKQVIDTTAKVGGLLLKEVLGTIV